jgi:predicted proteasome-type protease
LEIQIKELKGNLSVSQSYIKTIEKKLRASKSMLVDTDTHLDLLKILEENHQEVLAKYSKNTFPLLFWLSQLEAARKKNHLQLNGIQL